MASANGLAGVSGASMGARAVNGTSPPPPASFPYAAAAVHATGGVCKKGSLRSAAPQLAAALTALLALAAHAVPQAWTIVGSMLIMGQHMSMMLLPTALSLLSFGAAAGAVAAVVGPAPSPRRGAWLGAALGCCVTLCTLLSLARFNPMGGAALHLQQRGSLFDPASLTPRLKAVTCGGLCMAGFMLFGVGWSLHGRRTRGGFMLGCLLAVAVHGFAGALCVLTPYCIDPPSTA